MTTLTKAFLGERGFRTVCKVWTPQHPFFLSFFLSFFLFNRVFIFKLIAWVSHVGVRTVSFPASEEAPARLQRRVGPLLRHLYGLDRRIISFQKHSKMLRKLFYVAHDSVAKYKMATIRRRAYCFSARPSVNTRQTKTVKDGYAEKMKIHTARSRRKNLQSSCIR